MSSEVLTKASLLPLAPKVEGGYIIFTPLCVFVCLLLVCLCARYLKKLWMDSDDIWWAGWVCDKDELLRFW